MTCRRIVIIVDLEDLVVVWLSWLGFKVLGLCSSSFGHRVRRFGIVSSHDNMKNNASEKLPIIMFTTGLLPISLIVRFTITR